MVRFRPALPPAKEGEAAYESVYEYEFTPKQDELPVRDLRDAQYFKKIKTLKVMDGVPDSKEDKPKKS